MKTHEEYLAALDAFLDGELDGPEAAEIGIHVAECAQCGAYVRDAMAIRAAFPNVEDVVVPDGFAESVMAALTERPGDQPADIPADNQTVPSAFTPAADVPAEDKTIPLDFTPADFPEGSRTIPVDFTQSASVSHSGERKAAEMDDWKEKWKKAALPLAACLGVILIAAGGFALSRGGSGGSPAVSTADAEEAVAVDSGGSESQAISRGSGAAEFSGMLESAAEKEQAEDTAELESVETTENTEGTDADAGTPTEMAREESAPTPAPTEAPRPTATPTPVPTPTEAPVENGAAETDSTALPDLSGAAALEGQTAAQSSENPWDNVELTLPDDADYLFERYTPLEEEAGGALYAFSRDQYAALLDSLDAAGFVSHTSVPADRDTIYVYLERDSAAEWDAGAEEEEGETEPDFDPGEDTGGGASRSEVEDFARATE